MKTFPTLAFTVLAALFLCGETARARDWWVSPGGSGARDGSSRDNQAGGEGVQKLLDQLAPGDRLILDGGIYRDLNLTLRKSGTADQPITIFGQSDSAVPIFESIWTIQSAKKGPTAFSFDPGVSHVILRDITIRNYQHGVQGPARPDATPRSGLVFKNVDMEQIRHGFYLRECTDLKLIDCDLKRYSKHGFRFEAACSNVTLQRCSADCSEGDPEWEKQTEEFPFGFIVNDGGLPNTNFVFEGCISRNNLMPLQKTRYKNGDGFVVEGNSENVRFEGCTAANNQDGGFDLKVKDVRLDDCIAIRNKRDFRIWTTGHLRNCFAGWSIAGLWTQGGPIIAEHCTIAGWQGHAVLAEGSATGIEFRDSLFAADGAVKNAEQSKAVTLINCVETADLESAGLRRPPEKWNGETAILNSATYQDKGYRSKEPAVPRTESTR